MPVPKKPAAKPATPPKVGQVFPLEAPGMLNTTVTNTAWILGGGWGASYGQASFDQSSFVGMVFSVPEPSTLVLALSAAPVVVAAIWRSRRRR
jgi:hypothetical protein